MGLRIKAYLLGVGLTFISSFSAALGLGEITINSTLNQPLDAEVELLQVRSLTDQDLVVGLASAEAFSKAGVDRAQFLFDMKFKIDLDNPRGPRVKITSTKSVQEPFLNFLIEAQWPSGRLLREYTLLVDLPVFSGARSQPVRSAPAAAQPSPSSVQSARSQAPSRPTVATSTSTPSQRRSAPTPRAESYDGEVYGPVKASDTLWAIASKIRPDNSVSVQQTMLAVQRLNPQAFIKGNINLLRRGQVLRVPTRNDITELSSRDAIREVAVQNRNWNNRDGQYSEPAQLEGSKSYSATRTESSAPEGRLKLSSNDSAASEDGRAVGEGDSDGARVIANALADTHEELDAARRENSELRDRLKAMEEQVQTMEKLLEVSSAEMRALELSAAKTNEEQQEAEEAATDVEDAVVEDTDAVSTEDSADDSSDTVAEDKTDSDVQEPVKAAEEVKPQVEEPKPAPVAPKKTIVDIIMDNIMYVAGGVGVLILAIAGFLFLRKRDDGFDDGLEDFEPSFEPLDKEEDTFVVDDIDEGDDDTLLMPEAETEEADLSLEEDAGEAETEDVVAECDIHIAYGQYEQAEEKLLHALEKEPANVSMRLKLLEVFAATNAISEFDTHFAKLRTLGDAEASERAEQLRGSIDGITPFDESAHDLTQFKESVGDTQVASFNEPEETMDSMELGDDTLNFDMELENDSLLEDSLDDTALDLDSGDTIDELDFDLGIDAESEIKDASTELDELSASLELGDGLDDIDAKSLEDELTLEPMEAGDNLGLDDSLEADLSNTGALSLGSEVGDTASDELGDLTLELDDVDLDLDFDDVELDVDLGEMDEPNDSFAGLDAEPLEVDESAQGKLLASDDDVTQIRPVAQRDELSLSESIDEPVDFDLGGLDDALGITQEDTALEDIDQEDITQVKPVKDSVELSLDDDLSTESDIESALDAELESLDLGDVDLDESLELSDAPELDGGLDLDGDFDLDGLGLDQPESADSTSLDGVADVSGELASELASPEVKSEEDALPDFDFDQELDAVLESKESKTEDAGSLAENLGADDLDLSEFDDSLSADSPSSMDEPELSFDGLDDELGLDEPAIDDKVDASLDVPSLEDAVAEETSEQTAGAQDFEADVDLDGGLNLDALDQELDELASEFTGDIADLEDAESEFDTSLTDLDDELEDASASDLDLVEPEITDSDEETKEEVPPAPEASFSGDQLDDDGLDLGDQSLDAAISSMDFEIPDFDPEEDDDSNLGFLSDSDETATKLDLARAYIDMGDADGAKDILDEIAEEGNEEQKQQAETLLAKLG